MEGGLVADGRRSRPGNSTRAGVGLLVGALSLSILVTTQGGVMLYATATMQIDRLFLLLSTQWFQYAYLGVDATVALLGLLALGLIYRGRGEFGPPHASRIRYSAGAMIAGSAVLGSRALVGLLIGYAGYIGPALRLLPAGPAITVISATLLGLFLYWTALDPALPRTPTLTHLAFSLGIAGSVLGSGLLFLLADFLGMANGILDFVFYLYLLGWTLEMASLALWLLVYLRLLRRLGTGWSGAPIPSPS